MLTDDLILDLRVYRTHDSTGQRYTARACIENNASDQDRMYRLACNLELLTEQVLRATVINYDPTH